MQDSWGHHRQRLTIVHATAVVPQHHVTVLPRVCVLQSFFGRVGPQEIEQRFTLGFIEVNDVLRRIDPATPEIKRRLARLGHDTDQRMIWARYVRQGLGLLDANAQTAC